MKILSVDDSPFVQLIIEEALQAFAVTLYQSWNGAEGLQMVLGHQPNLVLLDLHLPTVSGYELLRKMRLSGETRHIPVIVMTSDVRRETLLEMAPLGLRGYLIKPFEAEDLWKKISTVIPLTPRTAVPEWETCS